jgi:hypothetical protein
MCKNGKGFFIRINLGIATAKRCDTPSDKGYIEIYSTQYAFAALKADGSITAWGGSNDGGTDAPSGKGYTAKAYVFE